MVSVDILWIFAFIHFVLLEEANHYLQQLLNTNDGLGNLHPRFLYCCRPSTVPTPSFETGIVYFFFIFFFDEFDVMLIQHSMTFKCF